MCVIYRHTLLSITCPPTVTSNAGGTLSDHFRRFRSSAAAGHSVCSQPMGFEVQL